MYSYIYKYLILHVCILEFMLYDEMAKEIKEPQQILICKISYVFHNQLSFLSDLIEITRVHNRLYFLR